ncbi:DUF2497 domain-containing protein [Sphingomonas crusticola]|uniref:DUF2497 domain-containing protein n=1 Tax=Sphingomonas crusticola TaxID=1697973 RepID=UPI000E26B317|nr:DUF2497 domain-containing protein [Sphingomonas crusticola]
MSEGGPEQSMEDVLASIKRIISADVDAARRFPVAPPAAPVPDEGVLELGEAPESGSLISGKTAEASKAALAALAGVMIDPRAGDNTLDGLVREMLRPMLKQWLEANLPELVERVVTREVARAIGR